MFPASARAGGSVGSAAPPGEADRVPLNTGRSSRALSLSAPSSHRSAMGALTRCWDSLKARSVLASLLLGPAAFCPVVAPCPPCPCLMGSVLLSSPGCAPMASRRRDVQSVLRLRLSLLTPTLRSLAPPTCVFNVPIFTEDSVCPETWACTGELDFTPAPPSPSLVRQPGAPGRGPQPTRRIRGSGFLGVLGSAR